MGHDQEMLYVMMHKSESWVYDERLVYGTWHVMFCASLVATSLALPCIAC